MDNLSSPGDQNRCLIIIIVCILKLHHWSSWHLIWFQTVKCLLIHPNPESALNEEAGKLLLEHYDDYSKRAQMMTDIHAKVSSSTKIDTCQSSIPGKKRMAGEKVCDKKKKDKKKAIKRL